MQHQLTRVLSFTALPIWLWAGQAWGATLCVWPNSPTPGAPYDQWADAAHDIQTAVNAASAGDTVLVTNGVYATGGAVTPGYALSNRVVIAKAITLQSLKGPDVTIIQGQGPIGSGAARCVYMTNGSALIGFTLTGGATLTSGDIVYDQRAGGAFLEQGGLISNCVLCANSAAVRVGAVACYYGGRVVNSTISGNSCPEAGGAYLYYGGELTGCLISSNSCTGGGGGVRTYHGGTATNCTIVGNSAGYGGGAYYDSAGVVANCVFRHNSATQDGGAISSDYGGLTRMALR